MYYPAGRKMSMPQLLGVEFATECLEALLVAFLLSQTVLAGFGGKFGFFLVAGVLAAIATNVSYWNWYGFPKHYIAILHADPGGRIRCRRPCRRSAGENPLFLIRAKKSTLLSGFSLFCLAGRSLTSRA